MRRSGILMLLVAAVVVLALVAREDPPRRPAPAPTPTAPAPPVPTQTPPPLAQADADFPDPTVIEVGDAWYAYGSYGPFTDGAGFQVRRSTDLRTWEALGPALAARPGWVTQTGDWQPWAPSVLATPGACPGASTPGCYVLFYTGMRTSDGPPTHCVAVAVSSTPAGPFTDRGPLARGDGVTEGGDPVGCGDATGYGNIDPAPFVDDDGSTYLYVSTDNACDPARPSGEPQSTGCALRPTISVIPLAADGLSATGGRTPLFGGTAGWQSTPAGPVVENPQVVKRDGVYHMLFSGGSFLAAYGMGHATASSPLGPFTPSSDQPWLASAGDRRGVGGGMAFTGPAGAPWLAYHARVGGDQAPRRLFVAPLSWAGAGPPSLAAP